MARWRVIALALGLMVGDLALVAPPTVAQDAPQNGVLVIYGNQKCPTDSNGNEVVVCKHRSAAEQFRIPKELREFQVTPDNESWAAREKSVRDVGDSGIGSCSVVGAGGSTGCFIRQSRADRKDNKDREDTQSDIP